MSWGEDAAEANSLATQDDFFASSGQPIGSLAAPETTAASVAPGEVATTDVPAWPQLLRLALLGTRQSGEALPAFPALPAPSSREQQLLLSAGTLALLHKAGYVPATVTAAAPTPAPADSWPPLGPLGAECLHRMVISSLHLDLLPGYLRRVAAASRRIPESLLVPLLQHATRSAEVRATLGAVLGARGRWLAALNPAWSRLFAPLAPASADPADLATWETGSLPERLAWLRQRWVQDADAAQALLLAALPAEPAKGQEAFLNVLADHLHPDAEPTLETLLKSRGQEVRRQAAALLVRLPGAALTERLWVRAAPLLTVKAGLLGVGKATLEVTLPTAWDKSWLADGIEEKNGEFLYAFTGQNATTVGPAAGRLGNLLALLPPQRWVTQLGLPPAELLATALTTEWAVPLLASWAKSTLLHHDAAFAAAFLTLWTQQRLALQKAGFLHANSLNWAALAGLVPAANQQAVLLKPLLLWVRRQEPDWLADLSLVPAPWPRPLTEAVLAAIGSQLGGTAALNEVNSQFYQLRQLAWQLPQLVAPNVAPDDVDWAIQRVQAIDQPHPGLQPAVHTFIETLQFQAQLTASLIELV